MPHRTLLILTLAVCSLVHAQDGGDAWKLEPLVVRNTAISDLPDRRVLEVGEVWSLGDEIVFWARLAEPPNPWALLSWKGGALRTIVTDGESATSRYAAPGVDTLHVHHDGGLHPATRITPGAGGRLYLTTGTSRVSSTYAWVNGRIESVLKEGDSLQFDNVAYTVASAALLDTSPDGDALLRVETSRPARTILLAAAIGSRIVPLMEEKATMPGLDIRAAFLGRGRTGDNVHLMRGGNLVLQVTTEDRGTALVGVSGKRMTKLLATGDPVPGGKDIIQELDLLDAGGADSYAVNLNLAPYLCTGTRCRKLEVPLPPGMEVGVVVRGGFVSSDAPRATFIVGTARRLTAEEKQVYTRRAVGKYRFDLLYFDGTKSRIPSAPLATGVGDRARLRAVPGSSLMLLEEYSPAEEATWQGRSLDRRSWELDLTTAKIAPMRSFETQPRRDVLLRDVVAYRSPTEVIVRLADGLYRLRRM